MVTDIRAAMAIAGRDVTKLFRDKTRILASLIFPIIFIGALGGSLQSNWGEKTGYNLMVFIFTGVLAQTLFQSTTASDQPKSS
jgi:ABC-2 type transport system permease protein